MATEGNPIALTDDQVRILLIHQLNMVASIENLLIEKGILAEGELYARASAAVHSPGYLRALLDTLDDAGLQPYKLTP